MTATLADPGETYAVPFREALRAPPDLTVWEWADEHRVLSQVASAEPGRWVTDRTPYLREILECLSPSCPVRKVIFRKSAQVGGTEAGNNWVAFVVDMVGGPMLIVQPTVELAKRWSKQRLAPMIRDTPRIRGKITEARSRDSGNTMLAKEFPGGILVITGANSAIGLRSMPAASLFFDEVDAYPDSVNGEGHAIELGERRAQTFPFRKILEVSTPKIKYASRIDDDFETSDRAYFYVPCPACGTYQRLVHTNLVYEEEAPHAAQYACGACGELLREGHKTRMLARGQWFRRMEAWPDWIDVLDHGDGWWGPRSPDPNRPAGFHIDALYSPVGWFSWGDVATEKEAAKRDEARAISFQNTILGLPYEERSDAPDWKRLHENRLAYRMGIVPAGAGVITAMTDVQRDRLEVGYYAWGPGFEGWLLDHTVIEGDTSSDQVWEELTGAANRWFPTATENEIPVSMFTIDMGFETEAVKNWVTRMAEPRRVRAVRGEDSFGVTAIIGRSTSDLTVGGKRKRRGFAFWRIAVSSLKLETYRRLRRKRPEEGEPPWGGPWLHYPQVGEEWFRQLTAERLVREADRHGKKKLAWKVTRPRNEALDLTVGALAGAYMLKMEQWTDDTWRKRMAGSGTPMPKPGPATGVVSKPVEDRTAIFDRRPTRARDPYLD